MIYYVDINAAEHGNGSMESPFVSINEAAAIAVAGDEILVAPGIYRERVIPRNGGTDEEHRITYRSLERNQAIITGAEALKGWKHVAGDVWTCSVPSMIFGDYNPYTTCVEGDWYFAEKPVHTGELFLEDKAMYEVLSLEQVMNPEIHRGSWDPEFSIHKWYTEQQEEKTVFYANFPEGDPNGWNVEFTVRQNCFMPCVNGVNYITVDGFCLTKAATQWAPPTAYQDGLIGPHWSKGWIIENCEISHSRCSGISLGKYLQPNNENKWSRRGWKDGTQTERDAICQAWKEGWTKEKIGSHIIRNCMIHDCGQTGIVGHLGGVFSLIEKNHIYRINNKQDLAGAEIGGIKMHAAIDCVFRENRIHHCTRGLWLDWQAQGTRVTGNLFYGNTPPAGTVFGDDVLCVGEDIFLEVSHGPTLFDNNILLSQEALRLPAQGAAFVHNFIGGSMSCVGMGVSNGAEHFPSERYTPYHDPHDTAIAGFMTILHGDMRFYNNIFLQQPIRPDLQRFADEKCHGEKNMQAGTFPYEDYPTEEEYKARFAAVRPMDGKDRDRYYDHLPVWYEGNVYLNGAKWCSKEVPAYTGEYDYQWKENIADCPAAFLADLHSLFPDDLKVRPMTTADLGLAFEPEQAFENPDGTPVFFDEDIDGKNSGRILPGPLLFH